MSDAGVLDAEVDAWNVTLRVVDRRTGATDEQLYQTIAVDDDHHVLEIGSSPLVDVTLADAGVHGRHCTLIVNDAGYTWLRRHSDDGAPPPIVDGKPVTDTVRFAPGAVVELGDHTVTLVGPPVPATMTWKLGFHVGGRFDRASHHPLPSTLEVFHRDRVIVGRTAKSADLVLAGGNVSRKHCMFYMRGEQVYLKDLGGTNGIWVNGTRAVDIAFGLKDKLYVGDYVITLAQLPERVPMQQ